ncbi:MAG: ABC transporter permease [Chloroflexi bacterium]|nr:MAG: ABC transporter permease [Chloroflexota bacterium]MBL1196282.1 ABC transporter permease [Chloroflexota bacterium]NOH13577.1 ABC transporter permease [Chloroflexota bacterium]
MVPYIFAGLGTMLAGQTGLFIVAQEGIMLTGASIGFLGAYWTDNLFVGVLTAIVAGGLFGLAFAFFTTTLNMNQFVTGLALFFVGLALSTLIFKLAIGVTLTPPLVPTLDKLPIPLLSQIPVVGDILFNQNIFVYLSLLLSGALYYFLYRTSYGLELRSIGENPKAADSLGINVKRGRYFAAIGGAMLISMAGVFLPLVYTGTFTEGITQGRGWLAIALTFFGGWRPHTIFIGALFFAAVDVFALRAQVFGGGIPHQFLLTMPYIATLLIMVFGSRWVRVPTFLGQNYDREKRSV